MTEVKCSKTHRCKKRSKIFLKTLKTKENVVEFKKNVCKR